jgi:hypothetical protein
MSMTTDEQEHDIDFTGETSPYPFVGYTRSPTHTSRSPAGHGLREDISTLATVTRGRWCPALWHKLWRSGRDRSFPALSAWSLSAAVV